MDLAGKILKYEKPKIQILSKRTVASLIADKVKISTDELKNWKIIARMLKRTTNEEATRIYESCKRGTMYDSTDFSGQFFREVRNITETLGKAPHQVRMKF